MDSKHHDALEDAAIDWYENLYDGETFHDACQAAFKAGARWQAKWEWEEAAAELEAEAHRGGYATG